MLEVEIRQSEGLCLFGSLRYPFLISQTTAWPKVSIQ